LTFTTELDDLIRFGHGDVKRLRNIRDTVKHDNFITSEDKKYVESLISMHLRNQPLDESEPQLTRKLAPKRSVSADSSTSNFSNNKKLGITAGVAAAIALIVVAGFSMQTMDQTDTSTSSETITISNIPLAISADNTSYKKADIISISGSLKSTSTNSIEVSIENTDGQKIWNEFVSVKNDGRFSTLVIAGGGGWESNGVYTLKGKQGDLQNEFEFNFSM